MRKKSNEVNAGLKPLNDVQFRGRRGVTSKALLAALLLGVTPAVASDLGTPTLGDDSAYTLTKVDAAGENTITKFEYNSSTGEFTPVYYRVDLKNTTYGEGADSKYFQFEDKYSNGQYYLTEVDTPEPGKTTITVKYDASAAGNYTTQYKDINSTVEATNPESTYNNPYQMIGGAIKDVTNFENVLFENNTTNAILHVSGETSDDRNSAYADALGGALYNDTTIGDISGTFINNSIVVTIDKDTIYDYGDMTTYGGAIYNKGEIGNINANFINNKADYGSAIYNTGKVGDIIGDFVNNTGDEYNSNVIANINNGQIGDITGNFISNTGNVIYNSADENGSVKIGNISGNFIANDGYAISNIAYNDKYEQTEIGDVNANFIGNTEGGINNDGIVGNITSTFISNDRGISNGGIIGNIKGDFIGNNTAIENYGELGNITGDFIGNGISIGNSGIIKDVNAHFMNNLGGAISNINGTLGTVTGNFTNNTGSQNRLDGSNAVAGGAILNYVENNSSTSSIIGNINADFVNNSAVSDTYSTYGGAIYNGNYYYSSGNNSMAIIGNITGDFINNSVSSNSSRRSGQGGAIFNDYNSKIGNITGNFIMNSSDGDAGAIYNSGTLGDITGDFIKNSADDWGGGIENQGELGKITGNFTENSANRGGAIYNEGIMGDINGNFISNTAEDSAGAIVTSIGGVNNITGNFKQNTAGQGAGAIGFNANTWIELNTTTNIKDSVFEENTAGGYGGAIAVALDYTRSTPFEQTNIHSLNIDNTLFENNITGIAGGAIYLSKQVTDSGEAFVSLMNEVSPLSETNTDTGYNLVVNNTTFKNNTAQNKDIKMYASGGAVAMQGIGNIENYNNRIEITKCKEILVDEDGNKIADMPEYYYMDNYGRDSIIMTDPMHNIIQNSYFENNKAISDYNALGGAISVSSTGSATVGTEVIIDKYEHVSEQTIDYYLEWLPMPDPDMTQEEYIQYIKDELQSDIESDPNMFATEEELFTALGIDPNGSASGTSHDSLEIVNTSFVNNSAEYVNEDDPYGGGAYGGAIFSQTNLKITADNGTSLFDGNKVINNGVEESNAIYMNNNNPDKTPLRLTLEAKNNGVIQINDKISGSTYTHINNSVGEVKPYLDPGPQPLAETVYKINITGDETGKVILNNVIEAYNAIDDRSPFEKDTVDISLEKTNLYLGARDDVLNGNNLDLKSGLFSMSNNSVGTASLNTFTISGDTNFVADVNLQDQTMDRITADTYGAHTGNLNVVGMNILNDAPVGRDTTEIFFAETGLMDNVVNGTGELPDSNYQVALTPIYKYNVGYETREDDGGYFIFTRGDKIPTTPGGGNGGGSTGNPSDAFNPAVLTTPVGNLAAGQAAMNEAFKYVFEHADAFTQLPSMERYAKINANKYALSTDFNENLPSYAEQLHNNAVWFRPYTTFETMNIKNGPKVDAITYGSLVGFDGDFKEMKNGWSRIFTGYAGYMGSSLNYSGVDTTMNGGLLGFTETFYKGNFWTAITASAGASVGESHTMYGKEDYTSLLAGVGSKTGYNFEFKDGKFIIQPIMFLSYTFVNTFDYKNAAGVNIESDPLHTIQLNPSVRFIANLKGGWQPYASVGMVWNLMNESKVTANNVKLPEMSVKPYVEYGVGVQRNWADKFTAFLQAMIRNGGRNGVALTGGFRFMLGSDSKNSDKPKVKKEIKSL